MYFVNVLVKERNVKHFVQKIMTDIFHHKTEDEMNPESPSKEQIFRTQKTIGTHNEGRGSPEVNPKLVKSG
jgi:hypothetical protein